MKKIILFSALSLSLFLAHSQPKASAKPAVQAVNEIPNLTTVQLDGTPLSLRDLSGEIAIIFFNTQCEHCQQEARAILEKKHLFKTKQLYFISAESNDLINRFIKDYKMTESNFHFSHASPPDVVNSFEPFQSVPAIFLFKNKKRIGKFEGTTTVEDIANSFSVK
jgi:peroxiredoxin